MYQLITEHQENAIKALFDDRCSLEIEYKFETRADGYYLTFSRMYNYVSFKDLSILQGYLKLAEILGCKDGDEVERYSHHGCETCDCGSSYTIKLKFW